MIVRRNCRPFGFCCAGLLSIFFFFFLQAHAGPRFGPHGARSLHFFRRPPPVPVKALQRFRLRVSPPAGFSRLFFLSFSLFGASRYSSPFLLLFLDFRQRFPRRGSCTNRPPLFCRRLLSFLLSCAPYWKRGRRVVFCLLSFFFSPFRSVPLGQRDLSSSGWSPSS